MTTRDAELTPRVGKVVVPPSDTCAVFAASGRNDVYLRRGTCIAVKSLQITNPDVPVVILYDELNQVQKSLFRDCHLIKASTAGFRRGMTSPSHVSDATFLRLLIPELVDYRKALYLDSDIVVLDSLSELLVQDGLCACTMPDDELAAQFLSGAALLDREGICPSLPPLNAGVLLIDVGDWKKRGLTDLARELGAKHGWDAFAFSDQSLLNLIAYRESLLIDVGKEYNFMLWPHMRQRLHEVRKNHLGLYAPWLANRFAKVAHWTGPMKPWDSEFAALTQEDKYWFCELSYQQFAEMPLKGAKSTMESRLQGEGSLAYECVE